MFETDRARQPGQVVILLSVDVRQVPIHRHGHTWVSFITDLPIIAGITPDSTVCQAPRFVVAPIIRSQAWVAELVEAAGGTFVGLPRVQTTAEEVLRAVPDVLV